MGFNSCFFGKCLIYFFRSTSDALNILDKMLQHYDRRLSPTNDMGTPTNVTIEMFIPNMYISNIIEHDIMVK